MTSPILNPRAVAYCRSVDIEPTVEALRARDGDWAEYLAWSNAQRRAFYASLGVPPLDVVRDGDQRAFTTFCETAAVRGVGAGLFTNQEKP